MVASPTGYFPQPPRPRIVGDSDPMASRAISVHFSRSWPKKPTLLPSQPRHRQDRLISPPIVSHC